MSTPHGFIHYMSTCSGRTQRLLPALFGAMLVLAGCLAPVRPPMRSTAAVALQDAETVTLIAAVQQAGAPETAAYPAPDGRSRALLTTVDCAALASGETYAYDRLSLVRDDGSAATIDRQLINCGGLGAFGLAFLFWSADSRDFYYTTARTGVPDGCGDWAPPVLRVDAVTGISAAVDDTVPAADAAAIAEWQSAHKIQCSPAP